MKLVNEGTVCDNIHPEAFYGTKVQKPADFRMHQGFPFNMKKYIICKWRNTVEYTTERMV